MRRLSRDDGATIVLVAISMVAIIGIVGLVIDVGQIFGERRQLGRGADAAVLAVAADCGTKAKPCDDDTALATGVTYASANADDGASAIDAMDLDLAAQQIWMRTKTINAANGSDLLDLLFMPIFGYDGLTVTAEATAIWGYPRGAQALPLIISVCEYDKRPPEEEPVIILFHDGNSTEDCNAVAGQDTDGDGILSGGFGWLLTDGDCITIVSDDNWVSEDPGAAPSTGCSPAELRALILDKTVLVPYFDDTRGLGATGEYHIAGVGAFHVTGYNFGGQYKEPSVSLAPCFGDERCVAGYFTTLVTDEGELGGEDFGVVVVRLVG